MLLLQKSTGVDFRLYKSNTLHRHIMRRAVLNKLEGLEDYARYLDEDAAEATNLYQDILINVTKFFRHPETFVVLKEKIFPRIIEQRTSDEPVRIWVLGCSTGEEAYSIAIAFTEFVDGQSDHLPIKIFATDLNETGIVSARAGLYPKNITHDVSPKRLRRFFTEENDGYQISKPLRDMCVFARQNVIADPPFSGMDLISCRNLLIYLNPVLQKQVMPLLHYALQPTGFLWLGSSELTGSSANLFMPVDKKHRFYSKKLVPARHFFSFPNRHHVQNKIDSAPNTVSVTVLKSANGGYDVRREADQLMLERYAPASIVINEEMEVLQLRGDTAPYLEQSNSKPTRNLLKLAREGLLVELRASIHQAQQDEGSVTKENLRIKYDGEFKDVNLEVIPLNHHPAQERHFLILLETAAAAPETDGTGGSKPRAEARGQRAEEHQVTRLKQELAAARTHLQSVVEENELVVEELQSASEEVQSSNEEFQSINKELETAKEELESSNEELTSLNQELQNRNLELGWLNSDVTNLLSSVQMPILMLDSNLRIHRFTPMAEKVLNLIATDIGRPISDIKPNINVPDLKELIEEAIETASVIEREVQDREGRWFSMCVRPYKSLENNVDGAVLVLADVDALKRSEAQIRDSRDYAASIIETVHEPLVILDEDLRVQTAGRCFYETFKVTPEETENRFIYDVGNGQWNIPELRTLLEDILPARSQFKDFEVVHEFEHIGRKVMLLSASEIRQDVTRRRLILLSINDITERKQSEMMLRKSEEFSRSILESSADCIKVLDLDGNFVSMNQPGMCVMEIDDFGEFAGRRWTDLWSGSDSHEDARCAVEAAKQGETSSFRGCADTAKGTRKCWDVIVSPILDGVDKPVQLLSVARDITVYKQAEEGLRTSELRYRRLFESARDGILILDIVTRKIVDANPYMTELLGYTRDELLGK
ncbi:MAG: PAS domain S-box protein, partial [Acidobacteriota bacterium]|nr:PAS domain S-box protein [Acidobacteriota bacterium]